MSEQTGIEWCDSTFNPWWGCTKISPACDNCYAEAVANRFGRNLWGIGRPRMRTREAYWRDPKKWNAQEFVQCAGCGWRGDLRSFNKEGPGGVRWTMCPDCNGVDYMPARRRVFCASMADVFDSEVPSEWRADLLALIEAAPNLDWLLLTKRIGNVRRMLAECQRSELPSNVWLGATVINQQEAERDVPKLLVTPAAVRFLSIEPMLGPVDLTAVQHTVSPGFFGDALGRYHKPDAVGNASWPGVNWVIVGGESGPKARPMHPDWVRSLRDQCAAAGVPLLVKQWGEWMPEADANHAGHFNGPLHRWPPFVDRSTDQHSMRVGKKASGRMLDGVEHNGFPEGK